MTVLSEFSSHERRTNIVLAATCFIAFILRVAYRIETGSAEFWTNSYGFFYEIATNLARGKGFYWPQFEMWAARPPVYPLFLVPAVLLGGNYLIIVLLQALVGTGTVACAFLIGRILFNERVGLIAAMLATIYPYYVVHDTALQETGLLTFCSAMSTYLLLLSRVRTSFALWAATGLVLGITLLTRTTMLPFAIAALLWTFLLGLGGWQMKLKRTLIIFFVLLAIVSGWLVRNELVVGRATMTSEAGLQFWMAHNSKTFSRYPEGSIDRSTELAFEALPHTDAEALASLAHDEIARSDWFMNKGLGYVKNHVGDSIRDAARKVMAGFSWTLNPAKPAAVQSVYFVSYAPTLLFGLGGILFTSRNWRAQSIVYLQFITFIAVSAIFWAHTNHRTYLDMYLMIFAAALGDRIWPGSRGTRPAAL